MTYILRNTFSPTGSTPIGQQFLPLPESAGGDSTQNGVPVNSAGQVTGSGPGYAAADQGDNRFLSGGKIQLSAEDPNATAMAAAHPNYQIQGGHSTVPVQFQGGGADAAAKYAAYQAAQKAAGAQTGGQVGAGQQASMENGVFQPSVDQTAYMQAQIAAAAKANAAQPTHAMARGGTIREPVRGVGMQTGDPYLLGENGPETVTPGVPQGFSGPVDPNQNSDPEAGLAAELQQVLGRHVFARGQRQARNKATAPFSTSGKAVNAPVIQLTTTEIQKLATDPEMHPLIARLIQAEQRGGIQVTHPDGTPYGASGPQSEFGASNQQGGSQPQQRQNNATAMTDPNLGATNEMQGYPTSQSGTEPSLLADSPTPQDSPPPQESPTPPDSPTPIDTQTPAGTTYTPQTAYNYATSIPHISPLPPATTVQNDTLGATPNSAGGFTAPGSISWAPGYGPNGAFTVPVDTSGLSYGTPPPSGVVTPGGETIDPGGYDNPVQGPPAAETPEEQAARVAASSTSGHGNQ